MYRTVVAVCCGLALASCSQTRVASPFLASPQQTGAPQVDHYRILANFNGPDGSRPRASLDPRNGLLYSTVSDGGKHGMGAVFRVDPGGHPRLLHDFDGGDGCTPTGGVTVTSGNLLFGTTSSCGNATKGGTVYSVYIAAPVRLRTIHKFDLATDGGNPEGTPLRIGTTVYGTTRNGGAGGKGTIYSIDVNTDEFRVLYAFGGDNDAANPVAGLVEVGGKLFGTSEEGGRDRAGTIYEFDPSTGKEKVLHSFDRTDGARPIAALTPSGGVFYGVTHTGGTNSAGVIFKFNPANGDETVLYQFSSGDGLGPNGPLVVWNDALYGTTKRGGKSGKDFGTVFRFTPATKAHDEVYAFSGAPGDGARPEAGLALSRDVLFGTTSAGGTKDLGTAFSIIP